MDKFLFLLIVIFFVLVVIVILGFAGPMLSALAPITDLAAQITPTPIP